MGIQHICRRKLYHSSKGGRFSTAELHNRITVYRITSEAPVREPYEFKSTRVYRILVVVNDGCRRRPSLAPALFCPIHAKGADSAHRTHGRTYRFTGARLEIHTGAQRGKDSG